jgi:hypothetical protein
MGDERKIHPDATVRDVVIDLLLTTLPPELRVSAPDLADRVFARPDVAPHAGKRWSELSGAEVNIVGREAAVVARYIAEGTGGAPCRDGICTDEPEARKAGRASAPPFPRFTKTDR